MYDKSAEYADFISHNAILQRLERKMNRENCYCFNRMCSFRARLLYSYLAYAHPTDRLMAKLNWKYVLMDEVHWNCGCASNALILTSTRKTYAASTKSIRTNFPSSCCIPNEMWLAMIKACNFIYDHVSNLRALI